MTAYLSIPRSMCAQPVLCCNLLILCLYVFYFVGGDGKIINLCNGQYGIW